MTETNDQNRGPFDREVLRFSDGMNMPTAGKLRVRRGPDGLYVIGEGMMIPVDSQEEGKEMIEALRRAASSETPTERNDR